MSTVDDWEERALERCCSHCCRESPGVVYEGRDYLRLLQALKGDQAAWQAHKVEPFFWSDADMIHVRLCDECASHLRRNESADVTATRATSDLPDSLRPSPPSRLSDEGCHVSRRQRGGLFNRRPHHVRRAPRR